jgi:hypothetical protein
MRRSAKTTLDTYAHLWPDSEDVTRRALESGVQAFVSPSCHDAAAVDRIAFYLGFRP